MTRTMAAAVLLAASWARAGVGDLRPVAVEPGQALRLRPLYCNGRQFSQRTEGDGTVNPHATIGTMRNGKFTVRAAIDSRAPNAKAPDVVRLDFSGEGTFAGKPVVPLKVRKTGQSLSAQVGPATLQVPVDGRKVPVRVTGQYTKNSDYRHLNLLLGTAVEGSCRFGKKTYRVRIIDGDGNLAPGDPVKRFRQLLRTVGVQTGDTLVIDGGSGTSGAGSQRALFGSPVRVDGTWYAVTISGDGTKVAAKPLAVETAMVRVPHAKWAAMFLGKEHCLYVQGGPEPIALPADQYVICDFRETERTARRSSAMLTCGGRRELQSGKAKAIDAPAGRTTDVVVGSPLSAALKITPRKATLGQTHVRMDLVLADAGGRAVDYVHNPDSRNGRPDRPVVEIFDAAGKRVYTCKLEYG
jgi:hypothetical protein